jgi:hypothetical protein
MTFRKPILHPLGSKAEGVKFYTIFYFTGKWRYSTVLILLERIFLNPQVNKF